MKHLITMVFFFAMGLYHLGYSDPLMDLLISLTALMLVVLEGIELYESSATK